jgi:hypothetical protein
MVSMHLLYRRHDVEYADRIGDHRLQWLRELGAEPLEDAEPQAEGVLFGYQLPSEEYAALVGPYPHVDDRPQARKELAGLEDILAKLDGVDVPTPRTWVLQLDEPLPDLRFPLFLRTSTSSWKRGGKMSKVRNFRELEDECEMLRRAFRWDATILAREWLDLATVGNWRYGDVPYEIRVWIVDHEPFAWSFHYLNVLKKPRGFPPGEAELATIADYARQVAAPFSSRLIGADFVKDRSGEWHFLEAGPGACCGTAHETVFKAVAGKLTGKDTTLVADGVGGLL